MLLNQKVKETLNGPPKGRSRRGLQLDCNQGTRRSTLQDPGQNDGRYPNVTQVQRSRILGDGERIHRRTDSVEFEDMNARRQLQARLFKALRGAGLSLSTREARGHKSQAGGLWRERSVSDCLRTRLRV